MKQSSAAKETAKSVRHIQLKVPADVYKAFRAKCFDEETNMRKKALELIKDYAERETPKGFLGDSPEDQEAFFAEATKDAIDAIHAAGHPTSHGDEKGVYLLYPDGRREYVKRYSQEERQ